MPPTNIRDKKLMLMLLKDFSMQHTTTELASELNITRVGVWKMLKRLEAVDYISLNSLGKGKTNAEMPKLNFDNKLVAKYLAFLLAEEAASYDRWQRDFEWLKEHVNFLVLYGSILTAQKTANDIDIIAVIDGKTDYKKLHSELAKIQHIQPKKIHMIDFTSETLKKELLKPNDVFLDAIKKGIVLFNQEEFVDFMKELHEARK